MPGLPAPARLYDLFSKALSACLQQMKPANNAAELGRQAARLLSRLGCLTLLEDDIVKKTTTAEMMARDSCDQNDTHAIRL